MTDANANAQTIAARYIDLWNEKSPHRRRDILAANWASDATYIDPLMRGDGHDGIDAMIAGVQQRFPDFTFTLIGQPNGYGDQVRFAHVRFSWGLGPEGIDSPIKGTDFALVCDGRIQSIAGFLDQIPQSV
jgi:SnoaL-like protein